MSTKPLTLLLIDPHDGVRRVLARRLDGMPGLRVLGETSSTYHGVDLAAEMQPQIILFDSSRPGAYMAQLLSSVRRAAPEALVIVFTSFLTPSEERMYVDAGADACLLKGMAVGDLAAELLHQGEAGRKPSPNGATPGASPGPRTIPS